MTGIDRAARRLELDDGEHRDYGIASFNIGSVIDTRAMAIDLTAPAVWPVKPNAELWSLRLQLEARFGAGDTPAIAVIGGGATGCEVAANLAALACACDARTTIRLIHGGQRLAPSLPAGPGRRLQRRLTALGVDIRLSCRVDDYDAATLSFIDGGHVDADTVVVASGLRAPDWLGTLGLLCDDGLRVDATLGSTADTRVFAAGDCANIDGHDLPRLGVFGVRQAPVLLANLRARLTGEAMQHYRPQSRWLSILELGDGTGLATYDRLWWHGRTSRWLKHRIDRRFLDSYRY